MLVENIRNITNDIVNRSKSKSMNLFDEKTILSNDEIIVVDNVKNNQKSTLSNIIAGSIAGATTALVTLPLDVIKTKR